MSDDDKSPIKYILIGDSSTMKIITEFTTGNPTPKTKKEINRIFTKLMVVKNTYFKKMCELELFLHETEKDKKIVNLSDNTAKNGNKEKDKEKNNNNKNKNEEHNGTEKEMIDELIK